MHNKRLYPILFILILSACTEKYDFIVPDKTEGVVIEAFISNKSYNNTIAYPSDGRYFSVKLTKTSDVTNRRGVSISGAEVQIVNDAGDAWTYTEDQNEAGKYYLKDNFFAAKVNVAYQLRVTTPEGNIFESAWEKLPVASTLPGDISIEETTLDKYVFRAVDEKIIETIDGINLRIAIPEIAEGETKYYRWTYEPIWIYIAPEAGIGSPVRTCWVRSPYYLDGYTLLKESKGNYDKELFFLQTLGNNRVEVEFSLLVTQTEITEDYYYFWKDLHAQSEKGGLYDQPPFNLKTNYTAVNSDQPVSGYFGVVAENAKRWKLNKAEISYPITSNIIELCMIDYGPPAPGELDACESCLSYRPGVPTTQMPWWW